MPSPSIRRYACPPALAILPKVEEAFKAFRYVSYLAPTKTAKIKTDRDEEKFAISVTGGIAAKGLDRTSTSMMDWLATSKAAAEHTRSYWGDPRAAGHLQVTALWPLS
ncbi:hypothetical protein K439DRAFT_1620228 [Ramaria rubella]|nr:hypothetical protein K439DRAFT_1620228 [Ramaria rubella]